MTSRDDPPRLRDMTEGVPASLASALGQPRAAGPNRDDLDGVKREVWNSLGFVPGSAPPAHLPRLGAASGAAAATKGVLAVALPWFAAPIGVALVSAAVVLLVAGRKDAPSKPVPAAASAAIARVAASSVLGVGAVPFAAGSSVVEPLQTSPGASARGDTGSNGRMGGTASAKPRQTSPNVVEAAENAGGAPSTNAAETELSLLARAQASLSSDPADALSLANEHERRFGAGALAQEREVIAIGALVHLGRVAEARARAARFHALYPTSAHGRRVDVLLEEGSRGNP
jgi:hypothetical protein